MRVIIKKDYEDCSEWAANYIAYRVNAFRPSKTKPFVIGLPTGSTPLETYRRLAAMCKKGEVSFEHVVTFNMDEYIGLPPDHPQSYHRFMRENFFNHIDIRPENVNLLDGMTKDFAKECAGYEAKIKSYGGIELFLGGVGSDGHIAFNEPFSSLASRTRVKTLAPETVCDNARFFGNDAKKVPPMALTVGIGTITDAREVMVMAVGKNKSDALFFGIEGAVSHAWPISALQMHPRALVVCDLEATKRLSKKTVNYFTSLEDRRMGK